MKELKTKEIFEFAILGVILMILVYSMYSGDKATIDKILLAMLTLFKGFETFKNIE